MDKTSFKQMIKVCMYQVTIYLSGFSECLNKYNVWGSKISIPEHKMARWLQIWSIPLILQEEFYQLDSCLKFAG